MALLRNEIRPVLRRLTRAPLFTGLTILTLAIGIGANSAIFSVINGVLLKPLPYPESERLVGVWHSAPGLNIPNINSAPFTYFSYLEEGRAFENTGLWTTGAVTVTGRGEPEQAPTAFVTDGILPMLGATPALGRLFNRQDDTSGTANTVILSHGYWKERLGGDASVLGKNLMVDSSSYEIIGVLSSGFQFMDSRASLFIPYQFDRSKVYLGNFSYTGLARLRRGVSLAQANADMARVIAMMPDKFVSPRGMSAKTLREARLTPALRPLKQDIVGDVGNVLWVLMATIGMVLLIACANVANLLLVRAEARRQELAVRTALGAGWSDLIRELLMESLMLALVGGALGTALAAAGVRLLVAIGPGRLPRLATIGVDPTTLVFTIGISIVAGLVFGLIPAFQYARPQVGGLREGGRNASAGRERHRTRSALAVVQVALALVLLIGAGLMMRTWAALRQVDPGFTDPAHIQTLRISIPSALAEPERAARMDADIVRAIQAIPGVTAVGMSSSIPTDGSSWDPVWIEGRTYAEAQLPPMRRFVFIAPDYFMAMNNRLRAGRALTWTEIFDHRAVAMVNERMAREVWGSPAAALGKRLRDSPTGIWREVIGVAGDERVDGADRPVPTTVYWPFLQNDFQGQKRAFRHSLFFSIRTARAGTETFAKDLREAVWSVNASLPLANVRTMAEVWDRSMARTSFTLTMLGIAGAMSLLLGLIGIYGVIAYSVSQRTREIGIRMALGAQQGNVSLMFLRHGLLLAGTGVVCGLAGALALTRWMEKMLFGVRSVDAATYAAVAAVLIAAAALASYAPARRASRVDPANALRSE